MFVKGSRSRVSPVEPPLNVSPVEPMWGMSVSPVEPPFSCWLPKLWRVWGLNQLYTGVFKVGWVSPVEPPFLLELSASWMHFCFRIPIWGLGFRVYCVVERLRFRLEPRCSSGIRAGIVGFEFRVLEFSSRFCFLRASGVQSLTSLRHLNADAHSTHLPLNARSL